MAGTAIYDCGGCRHIYCDAVIRQVDSNTESAQKIHGYVAKNTTRFVAEKTDFDCGPTLRNAPEPHFDSDFSGTPKDRLNVRGRTDSAYSFKSDFQLRTRTTG
jgi:hypothetical protein